MPRNQEFWNELTRLFTVVCQIDQSGRVIAASRLLKDQCKIARDEPVNFFELFRFKRPTGFDGHYESALRYQGSLFLGFSQPLGFAIRGQFIDFNNRGLEGLCFVGVPWLWWIESNAPDTNLTITDFPVHDVQMDQLFFMTTQQNMVDDLQLLNNQLKSAKDQLEQAHLARQSYFNHVSHEMRTPLNGVISALTLLSDAGRDERSKELIRLASHSANRLLEVINYTLETASVEEGASSSEDRVFDLDSLIDECLAVSQPKALEKGLELHRTGQQTFPLPYRGRSRLLRQVLSNLLGNAVKFAEDGVVAIGARIKKSPDDHVDVLRFTVADEGPGIPADAMARLFEPFATGLSPETEREQGTGLGLSIVKRFVEVLGGKVEVESAPGEGALFSFDIPLEKAARHELADSGRAKIDLHDYAIRGRVLLVDDMQTNLMLNAKVLESIGIDASTASSGAEALSLFRANPAAFDLIFLDLEMPEMDGFETARQIRKLPGGDRIPILALSAHAGESDRRRAIASGMNNFMAKPLVRDEVVNELQDWLEVDRIERGQAVNDAAAHRAEVVPADDKNVRDTGEEPMDSIRSATHQGDSEFSAAKIEGLLADVGADITRTLVRKFLSESAERWERLRTAIESGDAEVIGREAHTLGSSCFTFGVMAAGNRFRGIEAAIEGGRAVDHAELQAVAGPLASGIRQLEAALSGFN